MAVKKIVGKAVETQRHASKQWSVSFSAAMRQNSELPLNLIM